ncbi:MAG: ABC transporter [Gammaproteobacteria bacterium]|nr:MAG: ABC transporter [Gammaproteobacteria bacterium]
MPSPVGAPDQTPLVALRGISKRFPGVVANDAIDLALFPGRVHALLGENGAGKSTLVKMLYGLLTPDAGSIAWRGQPVDIASPAMARELGIAMVFQHFSLFESLTVLENIALGMGFDTDAALAARIVEVSMRYGLPLDPARPVHTLSVGARQRIEIVRCLLQEPALLVMDEPTSVLTPQEVDDLFATLERLAGEGMAILYISHKLEEIRRLCQEATILRAGRKVAETDPREESAASLAALMMGGGELERPRIAHIAASKRLLELNGLDLPAADPTDIPLTGISLRAHAGEIIGIAGVAGNGQDELLAVLSGERLVTKGDSIRFHGRAIGRLGVALRRRRGLACVPEERLGHAAVPGMTLAENTLVTARERMGLVTQGLRRAARARAFATRIIDDFQVACRGPDTLASSLSGGNLQKFIVGREILQKPDVLVISQPTWGVDAGAAVAIHKALRLLAREGSAVVLISQDLDELFLVCDRIGALCAGRLSAFHPRDLLDQQAVGILMGGGQLAAANAGGVLQAQPDADGASGAAS